MGNIHYLYGDRPEVVEQGIDSVPYLHGRNRPASPLVEMLDLEPNSIVLQFGTGDGNLTMAIGRKLERLGGQGLVFAEDLSLKLLDALDERVAEERLDHRIRVVPLSRLGSEEFALEDNSIDRFISVNVMQYLDIRSPYWQELKRVAKSEAKVLLGDWKAPGIMSNSSYKDDLYWVKAKICLQSVGFTTANTDEIEGLKWVITAR